MGAAPAAAAGFAPRDAAEFARVLAVLLPGLPPEARAQIGRELASEAGDTYAARGVPPPRWISDVAGAG